MYPLMRVVFLFLLILSPGSVLAGHDGEGEVSLPLSHWDQLLDQLAQGEVEPVPPLAVVAVDRALEGVFRKGVFTGELEYRFRVLEGALGSGHQRVPVLDAATSISDVLLDGRPTSLLQEGDLYTVGVDEAGDHRLQVRFFQGREDDRFARRLAFSLPPAGPTRVSVWVPEPDIEAALTQGAVTENRAEGGGTRLVGHLDARGELDLTWHRVLTHEGQVPVRMESRVNTLFTLHEALVKGVTEVDYTVLEGETDRVDLRVPPHLEVVDVTGDAVLQWYSGATLGADDEPQEGRVVVLLRYLVEAGKRAEGHDKARIQVHFLLPVDMEHPADLAMPLPLEGVPIAGAMGIQGPAGLQAQVVESAAAQALSLRDVPTDLLELTPNPLLMAFSFSEPPSISVTLTREQEVAVTSTLVDDIQASSVLLEDGAEVTKLRLRLRNNDRQFLEVRLPEGAILTQSLLDGQPIRPALLAAAGGQPALLFPLRQSERTTAGGLIQHQVQPGDTLGSVALRYLSSASRWGEIYRLNAGQMASPDDLQVGQTLQVALPSGVEEAPFVVEMAYRRQHQALGHVGWRELRLPALDVDTMSVTWHLYLPTCLAPLRFDANLTQYSGIHYDPLRWVLISLQRALLGDAWAGGSYENILSRRKSIYREEVGRKSGGQDVVTSFPLVGQQIRFERILPGREIPVVIVDVQRGGPSTGLPTLPAQVGSVRGEEPPSLP